MEDDSPDLIFGDNPLRKFKNSYSVELYLSNSMDQGLNNEFFTKFGLEIKNNTRVKISKRIFNNTIPEKLRSRPNEGDLIYIPWASGTGELYEIKFVNDTDDGYMLGRQQPYTYELELEAFKYSHEDIETGIEDIDIIHNQEAYSINFQMDSDALNTGIYDNSEYDFDEYVYQGTNLENATAKGKVANWNLQTNILTINNIIGEFELNEPIKGSVSEVSYNLISYEPLENPTGRSEFDNLQIKNESNDLINNEEINPFGSLGE